MTRRHSAGPIRLLAGAFLALTTACGGDGGDAEAGNGAIKVGAIFDLTGPTADVGTDYADGMRGFVDWIAENHGEGMPVVALMHNTAPFGTSPARLGGIEFAEARGIDLTLYEMPRGAVDYTAEFSRIRQSGARYVVFQNTSAPAAVALQNAASLGLDATFICLNWCANELLVRLAGEAARERWGRFRTRRSAWTCRERASSATTSRRRGNRSKGRPTPTRRRGGRSRSSPRRCGRSLRRATSLRAPTSRPRLETFTDFDMQGVTVAADLHADRPPRRQGTQDVPGRGRRVGAVHRVHPGSGDAVGGSR